MRHIPFWSNKRRLLREAVIAWLILFVSVPLAATISVLLSWYGVSEGYSIGVPCLLVGIPAAISLVVLINRAERGSQTVTWSVVTVARETYVLAPVNLRPNPGYTIHVMEFGMDLFSAVKAQTLAIPMYCESTAGNLSSSTLAGFPRRVLSKRATG